MTGKKEYTNDEVTVVWKPDVCIHSGVCVKNLAAVFNPRRRPWIDMEQESSEDIVATVNKCPSRAISIK